MVVGYALEMQKLALIHVGGKLHADFRYKCRNRIFFYLLGRSPLLNVTSYFSAFAVRKSTAEIISSSHLPAICSVVLLELLQSRVAGSGIHRDYEC